MTGWLATLLVPTVLWLVGRGLAERDVAPPQFPWHALVGFVGQAGLLGWCRRPFAEQLTGWVVGVVAWSGVFLVGDPQLFMAFALGGAAWGIALGAATLGSRPPAAQPDVPQPVAPQPAEPPRPSPTSDRPREDSPAGAESFALELHCPTCGAALAVPVYHRMAHCEFCSSDHVVVAKADTLRVVIPDAVTSEAAVTQSVVRSLRDRRYLELYDAKVRPLIDDPGYTKSADETAFSLLTPDPRLALVNSADAEVNREADEWAARIAPSVRVKAWHRFLSPYWHRMGTLYQAAFGRDRDGSKRMEFSVTAIEASVTATSFPVPEMGKLSYLKALRPLLGAPEASCPALGVELGPDEIDRRLQQLSHRTTELTISPIAMHSTLVPEVLALVYRPWHVALVELDGQEHTLLVDGGSARVEGDAPRGDLPSTPAQADEGKPPKLAPNRCPDCGADLPYAPDSVAFLCRSCFRLVEVRGAQLVSVPYLREEPIPGRRSVPFWRFPLQLRTAAGVVITDLPHLTDGIDGTFDQIGDQPQRAETFFVPAFRTRVSRAGVRLYRRLWPAVQGWPHELRPERFGPANPPQRTVEVTLGAAEARAFARVYLALAFTQRDLARAEVKGVRERFLSAELEGEAEIAFLSLPEELCGPLEGLFGRTPVTALASLQK